MEGMDSLKAKVRETDRLETDQEVYLSTEGLIYAVQLATLKGCLHHV